MQSFFYFVLVRVIGVITGRGSVSQSRAVAHHDDEHAALALVKPAGDGRTPLISRWRQAWPRTLGTYLWTRRPDAAQILTVRCSAKRRRQTASRD